MAEVLNHCQRRMWSYPDELPVLADFGGAGAGRTNGAFALAFRYLQRFPRSKALYVRQIYAALRPAFEECVSAAYRLGISIKANKTEATITLANGSMIEFGPLEDATYFRARYLGQSFQFVIIDELATWTDLSLPLMLLARLRHGTYPCRLLLLSNPGPSGHIIHKHLLRGKKLGVPFHSDFLGGKETVVLSSTARDNQFLDYDDYVRNLRAASPSEAHFQRMANGNFNAVEASLHVLAPVHFVSWPRFDPAAFPEWKFICGFDHGTISPYCAAWGAKAARNAYGPDGTRYPAGSYVIFWETTNADERHAYVKANAQATITDIAEQLKDDAAALGFRRVPTLYADDAVTAHTGQATIIGEFNRHGIRMRPAGKRRVKDGVARINELLNGANAAAQTELGRRLFGARAANERGDAPGLYLDRHNAPYIVSAIENAVSDARDIDTLSPKFALKHAYDALHYMTIANTSGGTAEVIQGAI